MYFSRATVGVRGWGRGYAAVFFPMNPCAIQA